MKKYLIFLLIMIAVVSTGFYINHRIEVSKFYKGLQKAISKVQGLTETILKIEKESSSMTYSELFEFCDKSVKDRTDIIVELRGLNSEWESLLKDSLVKFLNAENELVRNKSMAYRKSMSLSSNISRYDELYVQWSNATYRGNGYIYKPDLKKLIIEMMDDAEDIKNSVDKFIRQYNLLSDLEDNIASLMKDNNLLFNPIYKKYSESNLEFMNSSSASLR